MEVPSTGQTEDIVSRESSCVYPMLQLPEHGLRAFLGNLAKSHAIHTEPSFQMGLQICLRQQSDP